MTRAQRMIDAILMLITWILLLMGIALYVLYLFDIYGGEELWLPPLLAVVFASLITLALKVGRLQAHIASILHKEGR